MENSESFAESSVSDLILRLALALACVFAGAPRLPAAPAPVAAEPDWAAVAGPFPAEGSREAAEELAIMLWLQRTRTAADVARATREVDVGPAWFQEVLPIAGHPRTLALLEQIRQEAWTMTGTLKQRYRRPRPFLAESELKPAVYRETSFAYPSGHATLGILYARILAAMLPARRAVLLERGLQVGYDRTLAGVHWPSDVLAGQRLGEAIADYWLESGEHQALLREIGLAEWR